MNGRIFLATLFVASLASTPVFAQQKIQIEFQGIIRKSGDYSSMQTSKGAVWAENSLIKMCPNSAGRMSFESKTSNPSRKTPNGAASWSLHDVVNDGSYRINCNK